VGTAGTGAQSNGRLQVRNPAGAAGVAGPGASQRVRALGWIAVLGATAAALGVGLVGIYRYLDNFWLYRGYPPPRDPVWVREHGTEQTIAVRSPAIGGRSQQVLVWLPPGYASHPRRRYAVFYLLHGSPGLPNALLLTVKAGVVEDELLAKRVIRPMILVMPFGSSSRFTDTEWANGVRRESGWETFLARDVVHAIDTRYRTIRSPAGRALAGLSEGGYGSLNVGLHHPGEFRVLESWSGYQRADNILSVFGGHKKRLAFNSPQTYVPQVARGLRREGTYVWFYSSRGDRALAQNVSFAHELAHLRIRHSFLVVPGGHDWRAWRENFPRAIIAASKGLGRG
jgi:enterochelin esterase-like enzyme